MKYPIQSGLKPLLENFGLLANFDSTNCMTGQPEVIDEDFVVAIDSEVSLWLTFNLTQGLLEDAEVVKSL